MWTPSATRGADGVHIADNVRDGHIGCGKLFDKTLVAGHPGDGRVFTFGGDSLAAGAADGAQRVVVDFAAGNYGNLRVQQLHETAQDAAFCLATQPEQNKIMAREEGIDDLRHNGVFITVDTGKERLVFLHGAEEVAADLVLYRKRSGACVEIRDALEFAERARF